MPALGRASSGFGRRLSCQDPEMLCRACRARFRVQALLKEPWDLVSKVISTLMGATSSYMHCYLTYNL